MAPVVGLDYLPAVAHAPGAGRYTRELVRALAPMAARPELALFEVGGGPRALGEPDLGLVGAARLRRLSRRWPRRLVAAAGRLGWGADRWLGGVDLFHRVLPGHPPVTRAPEVQPVAELPPEGTPADAELGAACRRAAAVVVFSAAYGRRVAARYGLDPARVHRTPVGSEHWERALPRVPPPPARPVVLVLGAVRAARRPATVLVAFEHLLRGGVDAELHLVGGPGDAADPFRAALAASPARGSVRWSEAPREADMPRLAAGASVLLHLATDEGSPVTPLELLRFGRGVVAEDLPAFREALGDEAVWVPADPAPELVADALARALLPGSEAAAPRRRAVAAAFTWAATAEATVAVWDAVFDARDGDVS